MNFTRATYLDAAKLAARLRAVYARSGWHVRIDRPLFKGDVYRISVSS